MRGDTPGGSLFTVYDASWCYQDVSRFTEIILVEGYEERCCTDCD